MLYIVQASLVVNCVLEHVGINLTPNLAGLPHVSHLLIQFFLNVLSVGARLTLGLALAGLVIADFGVDLELEAVQAVQELRVGQGQFRFSFVLRGCESLLDVSGLGQQVGELIAHELRGVSVILGGEGCRVVQLGSTTAVLIRDHRITTEVQGIISSNIEPVKLARLSSNILEIVRHKIHGVHQSVHGVEAVGLSSIFDGVTSTLCHTLILETF